MPSKKTRIAEIMGTGRGPGCEYTNVQGLDEWRQRDAYLSIDSDGQVQVALEAPGFAPNVTQPPESACRFPL